MPWLTKGQSFDPMTAQIFLCSRRLVGRRGGPVGPQCIAQLRNASDHGQMSRVETIGQRIKRERLARELTQRQLAEMVDVGVPHISKIEADRENPGEPLLTRLADVFELDADELFLVARRLPDDLAEDLAADPAAALALFRTMRGRRGAG
jgi:transcriptional regulator with XRE-family HTH domain